jgi:predicted enzyme related to lactoylglutathione lyase
MKINGIDALYYSAKDFARARAFYTRLIGTEPTAEFGDSACEWSLSDGAAFGVVKGDHFRPASGVLFNVDDVKAAVEELRTAGVTFDDGGEVEESPVCFMAFGNDPEGNAFILHQRR